MNAKVAIVEDDPDDILLFRKVMSVLGRDDLALNIMRDGAQFMSWLDDQTVPPRLVLLDLNLPRMSGGEVLEAMARRCCDWPIVVYSTSEDARERERCLALGAREFVSKPASFENLVAVLGDLLERYLA